MLRATKFQLLIILFVGLNLLSINAVASDSRNIAYNKINDILLYLQKKVKSPFVKTRMYVSTKSEKVKLSEVKLWLISNNKQTEINIDNNGDVSLPIYPTNEAKQYSVKINQKKGQVSINMAIEIDLDDKTNVSYYDLFIILDDINNYTAKMAGMASWFIPDRDRLKFLFNQPASIQIAMDNGFKTFKTNDENIITIKRKRNLLKKNPMVIFSRKPTAISPEN